MSVWIVSVLCGVTLWAAWLILSLRQKLSSTQAELSIFRKKDHVCQTKRLRLTRNRLTTFCECGRVVGMYLCIPVGTESEVEYGPAIETENGDISQ